jgi:hypothetical protein
MRDRNVAGVDERAVRERASEHARDLIARAESAD